LVASADKLPSTQSALELAGVEGATLTVEYGDFSEALEKAAVALSHAKKDAANDHQVAMLNSYISSCVFYLIGK
jgi:dipeptidyl-peptidase-3